VVFALQSSSVVVNAVVVVIQPAQVDWAKEDIPGPAGQGLETDRQRRQHVGEVHPALVPSNAAVGRDAPNLAVLGIRDRLQSRHVQPIGGAVEHRRPALLQRLVGPHLVEGTAEGVEAPLLGAERAGRGAGGLGFEVSMHPFGPAILVRGSGLDELGPHLEPEPPDAGLGEAAEGAGGKGLPIVGANPLGESVGAEEAPKDLLGRLEQRTLEPVAGQPIARVGILDGERIAVAPIAELERSLEVDRPDGIGPGDRGLGAAGVRAELRAAPMPDAAVSHQDPMTGGNGGHPLGGMGLGQELVPEGLMLYQTPSDIEDARRATRRMALRRLRPGLMVFFVAFCLAVVAAIVNSRSLQLASFAIAVIGLLLLLGALVSGWWIRVDRDRSRQ
jgi:hypothetical protein